MKRWILAALMVPSLALAGTTRDATRDGAPEDSPEATRDAVRDEGRFLPPEPLPRAAFPLPETATATLSNGVQVLLVESHELPLVSVRAVFDVGSYADFPDRAGLAVATLDMMNEGAGDRDVLALSADLKALATELSTSASYDSASVSLGSLKRNLEPSLDLWASVLLEPSFPDSEWERLERQYLQDLDAQITDPSQISRRVYRRVMYGPDYVGRNQTAESIAAIDTESMRAWYERYLVPENALILVGGDTTISEIVPLLEARLGDWSGPDERRCKTRRWEKQHGAPAVAQRPSAERPEVSETTIYLIDKPGAAQSVIRGGRFVGDRTADGWSALEVGNMAWGGIFTARLNMNLREDKGYTYGASSFFWHDYGPSMWAVGTSVKTDTTALALTEIFTELSDLSGERPLTADEIAYMQSSTVNGYAARFEQAGYLLNRQAELWLYDLPEDWVSGYLDRVESVSPEAAQSAFAERVATQPLAFVVVGDLTTIREGVEALGYPTIELDVDGLPISADAGADASSGADAASPH